MIVYVHVRLICVLVPFQVLVSEYEKEIMSLKEELAMHNTLVGTATQCTYMYKVYTCTCTYMYIHVYVYMYTMYIRTCIYYSYMYMHVHVLYVVYIRTYMYSIYLNH